MWSTIELPMPDISLVLPRFVQQIIKIKKLLAACESELFLLGILFYVFLRQLSVFSFEVHRYEPIRISTPFII